MNNLSFQLYDRPLHPELFDAKATRRVCRDGYTLTVHLTPAGHVISWNRGNSHFTEVTGPSAAPLPRRGRLLRHRLQGEHCESATPAPGMAYQMSSQVEILPPNVFTIFTTKF